MGTLLFTHPICQEHDMGSWHPEAPVRLKAILERLGHDEFAALECREAPLGTIQDIERVHAAYYAETIFENVPKSGHVHLDADTAMNAASGQAALRAVGALCSAVDAVLKDEAKNAFCAVRPPGHHAEVAAAMGFCLFNNVAIAAEYARKVHGLDRVAVIDFDGHHGNGSQNYIYRYKDLFYGSSHQWPAYPGTGMAHETGESNNIRNVQLRPGTGSKEFREGYSESILPALRSFSPQLLLISAGFDGHARDPLLQLQLETADYEWVTRELLDVADNLCDGRVVSTLEGGYDLSALADGVGAHMHVMMEADGE